MGYKVWDGVGSELKKEFELTEQENDYVWRLASRMYEDDPELVIQNTRFDRRGLPCD